MSFLQSLAFLGMKFGLGYQSCMYGASLKVIQFCSDCFERQSVLYLWCATLVSHALFSIIIPAYMQCLHNVL